MKDFREELHKLFDRFESGQNFSFSKYADGEWAVINNMAIGNGEFSYDPRNVNHVKAAELLRSSFLYGEDDKGYFIGISCPCCQGQAHYDMLHVHRNNKEQVTFANIFVNSNYNQYVNLFFPEYEKREIILVANEKAQVGNLPFDIEQHIKVGDTAFVYDLDKIDKIKDERYKGKTFLFACGPFGNILAHQLWEDNQDNTYLDIGSTLNPWLKSEGFRRDYYLGKGFSTRFCNWSE